MQGEGWESERRLPKPARPKLVEQQSFLQKAKEERPFDKLRANE
jgi:hypothetical protein